MTPEPKHRRLVGGLWDVVGPLQHRFLVDAGLRPEHHLLDVGCGSLRGGVHYVRYLEPGHYCGIDASAELLEAGRGELAAAGLADRGAELAHDASFDVGRFGREFDCAVAVSLFTHLPLNSIMRCLLRVQDVLRPGAAFHATIFENPRGTRNLDELVHPFEGRRPLRSFPDADPYHYGRDALEWLCEGSALELRSIEDWGHPRGQRMATFVRTR